MDKIIIREYFKPILTFEGYTIYDVEHSVERFTQRLPLSLFHYEKVLKKAILWLINNNKDKVEDRYIFISNRHKFGIQVDWRKDKKDNKFAGFTATTLSDKEMNFVKYNDNKIIVESFKKNGFSLKEAREFLKNQIGYCNLKVSRELKNIGYNIFYEDGKVYYTFNVVKL